MLSGINAVKYNNYKHSGGVRGVTSWSSLERRAPRVLLPLSGKYKQSFAPPWHKISALLQDLLQCLNIISRIGSHYHNWYFCPPVHVSRVPASPLVVSGVSHCQIQPSESPRDLIASVIIIITRHDPRLSQQIRLTNDRAGLGWDWCWCMSGSRRSSLVAGEL